MIAIASKEIYRLDIKINVNGDKESSNKVKKVEETAEKAKKKLKDLGNQTASPTAKLNDKMSSPLDKLESKTKKLSDRTISPTAKLKDNATSGLDKVKSATEKLNNKEAKVKVKAEDQASSVIEKANNKLTSWLKAGTKKVISIALAGTLAMGGFGATTAIKTYSDFEKGLSNVKAVSQATDSEMKQLSNTAKSLGASTEWSAVQVTQAEELLGQAGFSTKENISALPGLLSLASAGDLDLAAATDIASGTLRSFNIDASNTSHVADVLALSASATNSDVTDLGETMKYVAPVSASLGISFEDTAAAAGLLSNQNIKGSQAGTVLRQAMARLASPTKEAAGLMKTYGINAFDTQGNMKPLSGVVDNLNSSLGKLTSQQRADIISTIFGTESMSGVLALMNQGGQSLSDLSKRLSDANGAAKDMANTKLDNLSGQWKILKSAVEGMNIALGERLAPYAKQFVTWFTGKIPDITDGIVNAVDYLSNHTEDIKETAIAIGTVVTAIAGFNIAGSIGNSISGISNLVSLFKGASVAKDATEAAAGISKVGLAAKILPALFSPAGLAITAGVAATAVGVHEYNKLMNESILTAKEDLDPIERFMDSISGNMHKSKAELEELNLIYDDFGEGVSESFKSAAKDASKSLLNIEMDINRLTRNGTLDEGGVNTFKNYVNDFAYEGINAMKEQKDKIESEFNKTFMLDGVLNETEKNVTESLSEYFETGINKQMQLKEDIYGILNETFVDHSKDLDTAMAEIKEKLSEMKALELEYSKADNAYEKAYAQNQYINDAEKVSGLDSASELLKSRADEHNKQLDEIDNNYAGTLAYYDSLLSNNNITDEEKNNFEAGKTEALKTRKEALKQAEEDWKSDLETLYSAYPKAKDQNGRSLLNEETGAIFSKPELKSQDTMAKIQNSHSQLEGITQSGVYALKNDLSGNLEQLYVSVDEKTGAIKSIFNATTNDIGSYSDKEKEKMDSLKDSYSSAGKEINYLLESHARLNTSTGELMSAAGTTITSLENVTAAGDGLITGIMEINNTPYKVTCDLSGTIQNIQSVTDATESMPKESAIDVTTDGTAQETKSEITSVITKADEADGKTITITTIFKKVSQWFDDIFKGNSEVDKNANGTHYSESGLSTVDERGWELADRTVPVIGQYNNNPLVNLQKGTKIRNHMNSVNDMRAAVQQEVARKTPKQKVEVYQPQVAMAGGGNQFSFGGMNINVNGNQDVEAMIQEAMQQFGQNLRDAFSNIKK